MQHRDVGHDKVRRHGVNERPNCRSYPRGRSNRGRSDGAIGGVADIAKTTQGPSKNLRVIARVGLGGGDGSSGGGCGLGGALLGQKKYADAEPLLLAGYEGMKQRRKTIPADVKDRLPVALDRVIELYTAMEKPDEVKKWRAERAKYPEVGPMPRVK